MKVSYQNQLNFHASHKITLSLICTRYTEKVKLVHIDCKPPLPLVSHVPCYFWKSSHSHVLNATGKFLKMLMLIKMAQQKRHLKTIMHYFCTLLGHQKRSCLKGFYPCHTSTWKAQVFELPLHFPLTLSLPGLYSSFKTEIKPHFLKKCFLGSLLFSLKTLCSWSWWHFPQFCKLV